jgi:hypothetical protein
MKKLLAGSLALALASAGAIGWAGVSSAQLPEPQAIELGVTLSADVVDPGQQITATPNEPCTPEEGGQGVVGWIWFDAEDGDPSGGGDLVPMGEDGSWGPVTFAAPNEPGEYWFSADCMPLGVESWLAEVEACGVAGEGQPQASPMGGDENGAPPDPEQPEFDCVFEFAPALFTVAGEAPPEGPPSPKPGPGTVTPRATAATPVRGTPQFTG